MFKAIDKQNLMSLTGEYEPWLGLFASNVIYSKKNIQNLKVNDPD